MIRRLASLGLLLALCAIAGQPASAQPTLVSKGDGGSVKVDLGYGIAMNKESSLTREWHIINDTRLPLQIESGSVAPKYVTGRSRGDFRYNADFVLTTTDKGVKAYEVIFLVLDVFGERQRVLSSTSLVDIPAQGRHSENAQWNLFSESDAATAFYSIAYVASVRTDSGQIYRANDADILREIQKISSVITASDIEREKPKTPGG